jgi:hypothetical protein
MKTAVNHFSQSKARSTSSKYFKDIAISEEKTSIEKAEKGQYKNDDLATYTQRTLQTKTPMIIQNASTFLPEPDPELVLPSTATIGPEGARRQLRLKKAATYFGPGSSHPKASTPWATKPNPLMDKNQLNSLRSSITPTQKLSHQNESFRVNTVKTPKITLLGTNDEEPNKPLFIKKTTSRTFSNKSLTLGLMLPPPVPPPKPMTAEKPILDLAPEATPMSEPLPAPPSSPPQPPATFKIFRRAQTMISSRGEFMDTLESPRHATSDFVELYNPSLHQEAMPSTNISKVAPFALPSYIPNPAVEECRILPCVDYEPKPNDSTPRVSPQTVSHYPHRLQSAERYGTI